MSSPHRYRPGTGDISSFVRDGFVVVDRLVASELVGPLRERFERLFRGEFETGTAPDEVNWQYGASDPALTRQICNGWKADTLIARTVLDAGFGECIARLGGWPGARIIQDNVLWKPPGARSLGFHRDNAYLAWYRPREMLSCWIALDDTRAAGGTVEFARGSHRWPHDGDPEAQFHAPADHRAAVRTAATRAGVALEIVPVEVHCGGGAFHHGWTWHGSGPNATGEHRRALVVHCASSEARFDRAGFGEGIGPVYSRYRRLVGDEMDENHFPILWREDGYRTPGI